ncbi:MAG TPA: 6-bladed beta-propeller [Anaerolineales bacterium]|nr:6-bladed beta-propeller [Anaerolineales bacterium]
MSQAFNCPNCNAPLDYDASGGLTVRCPYCNSSVVVPEMLRSSSGAGAGEQERQQTSQAVPSISQLERIKDVRDLALAGKKIAAIKLFRELFGTGLKESKDAVEALARGEPVNLTNLTIHPAGQGVGGETLETVVRTLAAQGKKIEAIKVYRQATDVSLKEAKDAVEAIQRGASLADAQWEAQKVRPQAVNQSLAKPAAAAIGTATAGASCLGIGFIIFMILATVGPILIGLASPGGPLSEPWERINPWAKARIELSFGGEGTGVGVFEDARHVAVDNNGHIFVAEYSGGRVQVFDENGKFINQWLGRGNESSDSDAYITGMAADRSGVVYIVVGGGLFRYDGLSGELLGEILPPEDNYCDWVTVAPDGSLVTVWSWSNDDIIRFDRHGQANLVIPSSVSSVDKDAEAGQVAVDGAGTMYVLDDWDHSVFIFSSDGRYVSRFGSEGEDEGQFTMPYTLAVDNQSRIYISDFDGVLVFANDGRYLDTISTSGYVYGMTFDDQNRLYVVTNNEKVIRFTAPNIP